MKTTFFILLIVVFASCNSFDRMKYRHIDKVPAVPQEFSQPKKSVFVENEERKSPVCDVADEVFPKSDSIGVAPESNSYAGELITEASEDSVINSAKSTSGVVHPIVPFQSIKRDFSLLIAIMFIAGGLFALALCIFYFPYAGISWLWIVAFEIFFLYAAWRMIGTGVMFFITRFGRRKNYKET